MQQLTAANAAIILSNDFTGVNMPILWVEINSEVDIKVQEFSISREFGAMAQACTIVIPNVNPDDPTDTGYYNQQRDATDYNRPANKYKGIIQPGKLVRVKCGYGDDAEADTVYVFVGTIDTVKATLASGVSTLTLQCRGKTKKMVDSTVHRIASGDTRYWINYPITATVETYYLTSTDTNPLLLEIWIDVCLRSGYDISELNFDTSWTTRLNDVDKSTFKEITGTWIELAQRIADLLGAYMYEDEEGEVHLKVANNQVNDGSDTLSMSGTDWIPLQDGGYARAIYESIVVEDFDTTFEREVDWEFDYATNSIRRTEDSSITAGQYVDVTYKYCAWVFRPNQIYSLDQIVSHDDCYGMIVATNNEKKLTSSLALGELGDGSAISITKALVENLPELTTQGQLDAYVAAKRLEMRKHYFNIAMDCVAVPHLRVRDIICPLMWGTVTALYEVTGFNLSYKAGIGLEMQIEAVYYGPSGVY